MKNYQFAWPDRYTATVAHVCTEMSLCMHGQAGAVAAGEVGPVQGVGEKNRSFIL